MPLVSIFMLFSGACSPPRVDSSTTGASSYIDADSVPASCGVGRWGDLPVDDDTVYVDATAAEGGDGTEATPYATIQRGLNRAGSLGGGLVAVAAGVYPETLELTSDHADVHLAGRCREMVILDASVGDEDTPGVFVDAGYGAVEVSGVTLRDSIRAGLLVASGEVMAQGIAIMRSGYFGAEAAHVGFSGMTALFLKDSIIEGNAQIGVMTSGSATEITLEGTIVRDTRPDASGAYGRGIQVHGGATLSAQGCLIDGNTELGVLASDTGTQLTMRDTTVMDTLPDANGAYGRGLHIEYGANLVAEGCLIEGNTEYGLITGNQGTKVTLRDTIVRDTRTFASGKLGRGIQVVDGATLSAEGCLIEGNSEVGLYVVDAGTHVALGNTTVADTMSNGNGSGGQGVYVGDGAVLSARDCLIAGNSSVGLLVDSVGSRVALRNTTVRGTRPDANGSDGVGIHVTGGGTLLAVNCLVDGNTELGVYADGQGTDAVLRSSTIRDTRQDADGVYGRGVEVFDGATLSLEDCLIEDNREIGMHVASPGTRANLRNTVVRDTQPDVRGNFGHGIEVTEGAALIAEDCAIVGNADAGLLFSLPGTRVLLRDAIVMDTRPDVNGANGLGIGVQEGAALSADRVVIEGNTNVGVFADGEGTRVNLRDSTITLTEPGSDASNSAALGINAQYGAFVLGDGLVVASNQGPGLLSNLDAEIECVRCTIRDNEFAGAAAINRGILHIRDSTIESTRTNENLLGGAGIYAWPWGLGPPTIILGDTLIRDNPVAGVWLIGNGTYVLTGNTISGGSGEAFGSGTRCGDAILASDGITAWDGSTGLLLQDNVFQDAAGAGIFLDDASALVSGNVYSGNTMDLVVQNQSCDGMPEAYTEAPHADLCPFYSYPSCYAEFFFVALPAEPADEGDALRPDPLIRPSPTRVSSLRR